MEIPPKNSKSQKKREFLSIPLNRGCVCPGVPAKQEKQNVWRNIIFVVTAGFFGAQIKDEAIRHTNKNRNKPENARI